MVAVQVADLSHKSSSRVMRWWLSRLSSHFGAKSSRECKTKWLSGRHVYLYVTSRKPAAVTAVWWTVVDHCSWRLAQSLPWHGWAIQSDDSWLRDLEALCFQFSSSCVHTWSCQLVMPSSALQCTRPWHAGCCSLMCFFLKYPFTTSA